MDNFGFYRVAAATPDVKVADIRYNVARICELIGKAEEESVSLVVFPELAVTGYTCGDLFGNDLLVSKAESGIAEIAAFTRDKSVTAVVGVPVRVDSDLYNCAAVISDGSLVALVPKTYIPGYNEFYEPRWFASGDKLRGRAGSDADSDGLYHIYADQFCLLSSNVIFEKDNVKFAVEVCEDLWTPIPPSSYHSLAGADIVLNLSASNEVLLKHEYRKSLVSNQSARTVGAYVYSSAGYGESTQDLVYAGASLICENGAVLAESERFTIGPKLLVADVDVERLRVLRQKQGTFTTIAPDGTSMSDFKNHYVTLPVPQTVGKVPNIYKKLYRYVEPHPFVPGGDPDEIDRRCKEITSIQSLGLVSRLAHINSRTAVVGISGGLDSTLALLITVMAFDRLGWSRDRIIGVTMPGLGTTKRTHSNAEDLMRALGVTFREISVVPAVNLHFQDIGHDESVKDHTYENAQARERTQLLMDIANQTGGIVIGTGDLSELALGWCTYNGDHMSMYAVNAGVPKTLVRSLCKWAADNVFGGKSSSVGVSGGGDAAGAACKNADETPVRSIREILYDIIDTPISPELIPADESGNIVQLTEDLVGPYELHDFFLYHFFRFGSSPKKILFLASVAFKDVYDEDTIRKWLRSFVKRFFSQQFKRSCLPDGPKVGSVTLSPRGDWRMPSDAHPSLWLEDLE